MDTVSPLLLDKKQAAKVLSIGVRTLDKLVRTGQIRPLRIGRRVLFARCFLEDYISERMKRPEHKQPRRRRIVIPEAIGGAVN